MEKSCMRENNFPGTFIVVEGADGVGTTTQSKNVSDYLGAEHTFEPTNRVMGRKVDQMISEGGYSPETVASAFVADRMIHLEEEVIPFLKEGKTVVSDRYYHSTLVYQQVMGAEYQWLKNIHKEAISPDLTVVIDLDPDIGMERVEGRNEDKSIFEKMNFQEEVVQRYKRLPEKLEEKIIVVDGSGSKKEVFNRVKTVIEREIK